MKIIVVGGGIIGLAAAEELLRRGVEVELLERHSQLGQEASVAAAGILAPPAEASGPSPLLDLLLGGYPLIPEAVIRLQSLTGVDLQYQASGMLGVAVSKSDEAELIHRQNWQHVIGLQMEQLSAEQVRQMEPAMDGALRLGLWWPGAAQINTTRFVQAYRLAVEQQGGKVRTGVEVHKLLIKGEKALGVRTAHGDLYADGVLDCAGPWAAFDPSLPFKIPTHPVKGQIVALSTQKPLIRHIIKCGKTYFVQRDSKTLLVGTTVEDTGFDKVATLRATTSILERARGVISAADRLSQTAVWAGLRPGTPDGLPILGATPLSRFWLATGHFRNGILLAPVTGRILADLILDQDPGLDMTPFRLDRFLEQHVC